MVHEVRLVLKSEQGQRGTWPYRTMVRGGNTPKSRAVGYSRRQFVWANDHRVMTGRQLQVLPTGLPLNPLMCSNGWLVDRVRASNVGLVEAIPERMFQPDRHLITVER